MPIILHRLNCTPRSAISAGARRVRSQASSTQSSRRARAQRLSGNFTFRKVQPANALPLRSARARSKPTKVSSSNDSRFEKLLRRRRHHRVGRRYCHIVERSARVGSRPVTAPAICRPSGGHPACCWFDERGGRWAGVGGRWWWRCRCWRGAARKGRPATEARQSTGGGGGVGRAAAAEGTPARATRRGRDVRRCVGAGRRRAGLLRSLRSEHGPDLLHRHRPERMGQRDERVQPAWRR